MKTIKQLEKEKQKIEKQIEELKNKNTWRKFKCLPDVEISIIKDWDKPYNQIVIPKRCRLLRGWEFAKIIESEEKKEFLGEYDKEYSWFWLEQTKYCKKNNYSFRAYLGGDSGWDADGDDSENSDEGGRVVFVREIKEQGK